MAPEVLSDGFVSKVRAPPNALAMAVCMMRVLRMTLKRSHWIVTWGPQLWL